MKQQNKKMLTCIITSTLILIACTEQPQQKIEQKAEKQATSEPIIQDTVVIPPTVQSTMLVNNPTPLPQGYEVDTTHLKQAKLIDFNGDGKLDAFRVLKNPNKVGMKYLFEFRIADSDKVYFYESDDGNTDLGNFGVFEITPRGEKLVDIYLEPTATPFDFDNAPESARVILNNGGISINVLEETCGMSVLYLKDDKIKRTYIY